MVEKIEYNINNVKSFLGNAARSNNFIVMFSLPSFFDEMSVDLSKLSLLITNINFPQSRSVNENKMKYKGEFVSVGNGRGDYPDITFSFTHATNFKMKKYFEYWMQAVKEDGSGIESPIEEVKCRMVVAMYDTDIQTIRKYAKIEGVFPLSLNGFDLDVSSSELLQGSVTVSIDDFNPVEFVSSSDEAERDIEAFLDGSGDLFNEGGA